MKQQPQQPLLFVQNSNQSSFQDGSNRSFVDQKPFALQLSDDGMNQNGYGKPIETEASPCIFLSNCNPSNLCIFIFPTSFSRNISFVTVVESDDSSGSAGPINATSRDEVVYQPRSSGIVLQNGQTLSVRNP